MVNIEAIFAIDNNNGIAKNGNIPWKNKVDMDFFKSKTINNIVIMGSNTLLSLPEQNPLKNRLNIVVTRNINSRENIHKYKQYKQYNNIIFLDELGCISFLNNPEKYIDKSIGINADKIYIIGGVQILNLFYKYCDVLWVTKYKIDYNCDLFLSKDIIKEVDFTKCIIHEDENIEIIKLTRKQNVYS